MWPGNFRISSMAQPNLEVVARALEIWGATAGSEDSRDLFSGFQTRIWSADSDSGLRQKTRRGLWIRTGPTMPLHRFGGFTVDACAAPGDMKKREPGSSEEEVT